MQNIVWKSTSIGAKVNITNPNESHDYTYAIERDSNFTRYTGFYMEIALSHTQSGYSQVFMSNTETNIIPEFDSVGDCHNSACFGTLV